MTLSLEDDRIRLSGACTVDDAEPLLRLLQDHPDRRVDLGACEHLHGAVLQVLLAVAPPITGVSPDVFTRELIVPALAETRG